jgi:hypothetical protein
LTENWHWFVVIGLALVVFSTSLSIAWRRLFWFDEIYSVTYAKMADFGTIWRAVSAAADQTPIGYYLLAWAAYSASGNWDLGIRIVSVIAMTATIIVVFDCARRLTDGLHGLIAPCVLLASGGVAFAYEARSYSMMMLLSAMALWIWLNTKEQAKVSAVLFGAVLFLAQSMHFYGLLILLPFAVWEIYRHKLRCLPPPKLMAGGIGILCAFALSSPQILALWRTPREGELWAPASIAGIGIVFLALFPHGPFLLAGATAITWLGMGRREDKKPAPPMGSGEKLSWLFVLIPVGGYLFAKAVTGFYFYRYFVTLLPGIAVASACLLTRYCSAKLQCGGVLVMFGVFGIASQIVAATDLSSAYVGNDQADTRTGLALEERILADGKRFVTSPVPNVILEIRYHSKHPEHYVEMRRHSWDDRITTYDASFVYWSMKDVRRHAAETAVLFPTSEFLEQLGLAKIKASAAHGDLSVLYLSAE